VKDTEFAVVAGGVVEFELADPVFVRLLLCELVELEPCLGAMLDRGVARARNGFTSV
jgi:hypothetical protein